nr:PadR family transcriptional regulator [uncultured Enterobacter sp.]
MRHPHDAHSSEHHTSDHHGHDHHGRGGRRQRFFGHGELRLVILDILTRSASHGYELIKAIETLTQGIYSPSPGVIYPTLDLLQEQDFISIDEEENGRKKIAITDAGQAWLAEHQEHLAHIQAKVNARSVGYQLRKNPQMKRALENFKAVLDLKVNQEDISAAQLKQIVGVIDRAALEISQMD